MNMVHFLSHLLGGIGLAAALLAAQPAAAVLADNLTLSKQGTTDLMRVQRHLNASKTVHARFLQISSNGDYAEGEIFIQRPGRLRLVYDPPSHLMIVADGTHISFVDRNIDTATTLYLSMTPAELILRESIGFFGKDIIVTSLEHTPGVIRVGLLNAEEPDAGSIELVFSDQPIELRKWTVTDAQGIKTTVSLLGPSFDVPLEPELFKYKPKDNPAFGNR